MATPERLKSGNYRVRVYSHTDSSGKKIYESFTASTSAQARALADKFLSNNDRTRAGDLTVEEAVQSYIEDNKGILSPSTIKGYKSDYKRMTSIYKLRIRKITSADLQRFVKLLSAEGRSPKTIKNTYTTLLAPLKYNDIDQKFKVNLPEIPEKDIYAPEDEQIMNLYINANPVMKKVLIMACHSMRLSEICGAKYGDFENNVLHIQRAKVDSYKGKYEVKGTTKTKLSTRYVVFSESEMKVIGTGSPDQPIIPIAPRTVDGNFSRLREKLGLGQHVRLHSLRSYYASISLALNIPQNYIEKGGGWKPNSTVLRKHYEKKIRSFEDEYTKRFNDHMSDIFKSEAK
jgi:integrase